MMSHYGEQIIHHHEKNHIAFDGSRLDLPVRGGPSAASRIQGFHRMEQ